MKQNEVVINGVKYIAEKSEQCMEGSIYSDYIGEYCIIRSYGSGVFFAVLDGVDDNYVAILRDARRIHYWDDHTAAACTDLALYGITEKNNSGKNSRVCAPLSKIFVMQVIEIIPCSNKSIKCLKNYAIWTESDE